MDDRTFKQRALKVTALVLLIVLAWFLASVLLLAFAAVVFAVLLRGIANKIDRLVPVGSRWSVPIAVAAVLMVVLGALALFGFRIAGEFEMLATELPKAWEQAHSRLEQLGPVGDLMRSAGSVVSAGGIWAKLGGYVSTALGMVINLVLIAFGGLYLAADPETYRKGAAILFVQSDRSHVLRTFERVGAALWQWQLGQFIDMIIVGVLTGLALWVIGLPTAVALGVFAGVASFVPYVGPIVGILPALIIAVAMDIQTALAVLGAYVVIQMVESYVVQPLVQERMVSLPPALMIFSIAAFGVLFGIMGVLLAAPLTVFVFVAVRELYLREALGEPVTVIASPD